MMNKHVGPIVSNRLKCLDPQVLNVDEVILGKRRDSLQSNLWTTRDYFTRRS